MIKILKNGVIPKIVKVIYKATCPYCGCIFEFEVGDCKRIEKHPGGHMTIECPCCHKDMTQSSSKYENRVVECE